MVEINKSLDGTLEKAISASSYLKKMPSVVQDFMLLGDFKLGKAQKVTAQKLNITTGKTDDPAIQNLAAQLAGLDKSQQSAIFKMSDLSDAAQNATRSVLEQTAAQERLSGSLVESALKANGFSDAQAKEVIQNAQLVDSAGNYLVVSKDIAQQNLETALSQGNVSAALQATNQTEKQLAATIISTVLGQQAQTATTWAQKLALDALTITLSLAKQAAISFGIGLITWAASKAVDYLMNLKTHSEELVAAMNDSHDAAEQATNGLIIYNDMDYSTYYSVSFNLVSTNSSSRIVSVKQGDSYTTKISAFEGHILSSVSISMNGIDITDSVYDEKTGTILIQNVTNDVVISAISAKIKVDKIALNYSKLALSKNDKKKLVVVYSPSNAKIGDITWRSSDPENVIVSNGMVQGLKAGSAVITASLDGFEASCNISVISLSDSSGLPLSTFKEGAAIHIRENSASTYYIVSKHNYESELNGEGRTLLVRKAEYAQTNWGTSANTYNGSNVDQLLLGTFKDSLDSNIVKVLDAYPTKIYYTPGNGNTGITTISKSVFLLSSTEYGPNSDIHNLEGTILPVASQLLSAGCTGNKALLTRTPAINDKTNKTNSSVIDYFDSEKNSFESKAIKCTETTDPDTGAAIMIHPALTLPAEMKIIIDSPIKASSVTLNKTSLVIHVGEEFKLKPKYLPLDATYPLINYGSANPFIATVSDGVLVGVSVGTTNILVSVDNISTTCEVRVVE